MEIQAAGKGFEQGKIDSIYKSISFSMIGLSQGKHQKRTRMQGFK